MVKLNKIYTKTGDDGTTGLVDGSRVAKSSPLIAAIGDIDEVNSLIGAAAIHAVEPLLGSLRALQNDLFDLGADLATPPDTYGGELRIVQSQVDRLETEIDAMNVTIPPLTSFILPGGSALSATLHVARAACRRAERSVVAADGTSALVRAYVNRLSDWLFVACRAANNDGADDILWVPGANR